MKFTLPLLVLAAAFISGLGLHYALQAPPPVEAQVLQIKDIRRLSRLLCMEADVQGVREYTLEGYTGAIKCILIVHGVRQVSIDLEEARFISQNAETKTALLLLPPPTVSSVKLDHQRSKVYRIDRSGLWMIVPGNTGEVELVNRAMKQSEHELQQTQDHDQLLPQCREQAEQLVGGFGEALGWTIRVRWADDVTVQ